MFAPIPTLSPRTVLDDYFAQMASPKRPIPKLTCTPRSVDKDIIVRLKWNDTSYKGRLVSIDSYMNIQLSGAEEFIDEKMTGTLGQVLIRSVAPYADVRASATVGS